jgi:hypothetical protein
MLRILEMVKETFANRLTRIRKTKNISKYRLAKITGINET